MNEVVLDASAALAFLQGEHGAEKLTAALLAHSAMSAVNLAEVQAKLVRGGGTPEQSWKDALAPLHEVFPFTTEQAKIAGDLVTQTRSLGLSLGDRACLALAITLKAPAYTADQIWKDLDVGVEIRVIR